MEGSGGSEPGRPWPRSFRNWWPRTRVGWSAYFDVLSRVERSSAGIFYRPASPAAFLHGTARPDPSAPATRGFYRPAPGLLLLVTRLQLEATESRSFPGISRFGRRFLLQGHNASLVHHWGKQTPRLADSDHLLQVLFALSRAATDSGPLQTYMAISELDGRRPPEHRLRPATVRLLARKYEEFSDQYRMFSEFPELTDESIELFLDTAQGLGNLPGPTRGNAYGTFQANIGIWQILARQGADFERALE